MSYWKALAAVRDVRDEDLRDKLAETLWELQVIDDALGDDETCDGRANSIQGLRGEKDEAVAAKDEAERRIEELLDRDDAPRELERLEKENAELRERLAKAEPLLDAYSDMLAFSRKFISLAEGAGVKPRHVRSVKRSAP
jgi:hypothetical protein